jgi:hypothetical protein
MSETLSASTITEYAAELLAKARYQLFRDHPSVQITNAKSIIAEDNFGIVAIVAFETWIELSRCWNDAQASLVKLLDTRLGRLDAKSWDGYLVLLCPMALTREQKQEKNALEINLSRVRKMVFADEQLTTLKDVERALSSFLPLEINSSAAPTLDVLAALPDLIRGPSLTPAVVAAVIAAFRDGRPIQDEIVKQLDAAP